MYLPLASLKPTPFFELCVAIWRCNVFLWCCLLVVFESLNKLTILSLIDYFRRIDFFCGLHCLLYSSPPSLLLTPLFHPFQFSIGQFVKPPNLLLYTTNCTTFAWVTRQSLPREIVFRSVPIFLFCNIHAYNVLTQIGYYALILVLWSIAMIHISCINRLLCVVFSASI